MDRESQKSETTCLIIIGMAGSGKTTFVRVKLSALFDSKHSFPAIR